MQQISGHVWFQRCDQTFLNPFLALISNFWSICEKKHFLRDIRGFPANSAFFAVFAILNIRNQDRSILSFGIARHHYCDDFAKRKSRKCWKIKILWQFKVQKFQFSDDFFDFLGIKYFFIPKICHFCYPRSFMIFSGLIS